MAKAKGRKQAKFEGKVLAFTGTAGGNPVEFIESPTVGQNVLNLKDGDWIVVDGEVHQATVFGQNGESVGYWRYDEHGQRENVSDYVRGAFKLKLPTKKQLQNEAIRLWRLNELNEVGTKEFEELAGLIRSLHAAIGGGWDADRAVTEERMRAFHGSSYHR